MNSLLQYTRPYRTVNPTACALKYLIPLIALLSAPCALAQTATVTYELENVWLDPDITHPWQSPQQMTGTVEWTYTIGDFDNGAGEFTALDLPWMGGNLSSYSWTIEPGQIEVTLLGNAHGMGVDVSLKLNQDLQLGQPSSIDLVLSSFDIENGVSHKGHVISGVVVPVGNQSLGLSFCSTNPNSSGQTGQIRGTGSASVSDNDLTLIAENLPPNQFGIFITSATENFVANPGGSQGNLCLGGSLGRYNQAALFSGSQGTFFLALDLLNTPQPNGFTTIQSGETWSFQAWFRDANPGPTSNFTQGLRVMFL